MAELQARLEAVETKLAFAEDSIQSLNEVIASQDAELLRLRRELALLAERLKGFAEQMEQHAAPSAADEVPPHY